MRMRWWCITIVGLALLCTLAGCGRGPSSDGTDNPNDPGAGTATSSGEDTDDGGGPDSAALDDPRLVRFRDEVYPVLRDNCLKCHNPVRAGRSGGLDQTTIDGILRGGDSGPALVAGDPEASLMYQKITAEDEDERMPPIDPITEAQIEILRQWIADGAVWMEIEQPGD